MPRRRDDNAWVALFVLAELSGLWSCTTCLTRDELTERVHDHSFEKLGLRWKRSTAARRVREALEALLEGDRPVISAGGGFKLASRATAAERDRAAHLIEQQLIKLARKLRRVRGFRMPGEPADGDLFPEARR
jgi:hypothetical protein